MFGDVHVQKYRKQTKKRSSSELMEIKNKDALSSLGNQKAQRCVTRVMGFFLFLTLHQMTVIRNELFVQREFLV